MFALAETALQEAKRQTTGRIGGIGAAVAA
jgi:hypothetical protein